MRLFPSSWQTAADDAYDRYYTEPLTRSWLFGLTVALFALTSVRLLQWIVPGWAAIPSGIRFLLGLTAFMVVVLFVHVIVQHRRLRAALEDPTKAKHSLRAEAAVVTLHFANAAFFLVFISLEAIERAIAEAAR